ncbi:MAG: ATP-binding protein [Planctomycetes bacterium]|nr:ATP-binding protein [Planctomycetota bacterium]
MVQLKTPDPNGELNAGVLQDLLRSLRLFTLAEDLPAILEEAAREGWGNLEFLRELFSREEVRRSNRRYQRHLRASGITESYGLDHFNFELASARGVKSTLVRDLAKGDFIRSRRNLILAGRVGTGKSYLAKTLGAEALKRGFKVYFYNTARLLDMLYSKVNSPEFGKVYSSIRDVDLLILDDLAYMSYSKEKIECLFTLAVDRYELKPGSTIITSNTDVTEWWKFFPSKAMGMAFSDRLLDGAQGIRFTGPSIRQERSCGHRELAPEDGESEKGDAQEEVKKKK